ncbi:Aste57867_805 [Aphanomyces stellatus]|uniref:Aste57867_805 protein n=1 Tax=Aphanomyces stellatus TaxID=120398 RepID=A0A485K4R3_9STRA|nr:hypothetical protein As57867_000804 [Aphanomyces stellatus]VFT78029.1 Aste57867_805 [Aphanomyces stellatus]
MARRSSLPLQPDFFHCPALTDEQIHHFRQLGQLSVQQLLAKANDDNGLGNSVQWTLTSTDSKLQLYSAKMTSSTMHCHKGVLEMTGALDEVLALFQQDTRDKAVAYRRRFGHGLLHSEMLYQIIAPTADRPLDSIEIHWLAYAAAWGGVVKKRDVCLLVTTQECVIQGCQRAWVRALHHVDLACCPTVPGFIRADQFSSGHVMHETNRSGFLRLAVVQHADVKGRLPRWLGHVFAQRACRRLQDVDIFVREERLAGSPFLMGHHLQPLTSRPACFLCQEPFGISRHKSNCSKCGEVPLTHVAVRVVCSGCNPVWQLRLQGLDIQVRACTACTLKPLVDAAKRDRSVTAQPLHRGSSSLLSPAEGWSVGTAGWTSAPPPLGQEAAEPTFQQPRREPPTEKWRRRSLPTREGYERRKSSTKYAYLFLQQSSSSSGAPSNYTDSCVEHVMDMMSLGEFSSDVEYGFV